MAREWWCLHCYHCIKKLSGRRWKGYRRRKLRRERETVAEQEAQNKSKPLTGFQLSEAALLNKKLQSEVELDSSVSFWFHLSRAMNHTHDVCQFKGSFLKWRMSQFVLNELPHPRVLCLNAQWTTSSHWHTNMAANSAQKKYQQRWKTQ